MPIKDFDMEFRQTIQVVHANIKAVGNKKVQGKRIQTL